MSMNQDQIIELAKQAGFVSADFWPDGFKGLHQTVVKFEKLVRNRLLDDVLNCYSPDDTASDYLEKIEDMKAPE